MSELQRHEVLAIPKRRRIVHTLEKGPAGQDVLRVFYGEKEIVFDEPDLLPFGHRLIAVERFRAEEAMGWSSGPPYEWEKVRELLEALIGEEILKRATEPVAPARARTYPATLGECPMGRAPRTFSAHEDKCPHQTKEIFGREIELANLEAVIPVYRVAHPAMDKDGRQVGENNVTPRSMFLDLPTERRLCNYAGSRYQAEVPMNVTALRHMTNRWPELLSLTEQFRAAFLARLTPRGSTLKVGEAHLLTVGCLAATGYVMVRGVDPVPNEQLDAGLAAMFRLIDGVRIVTTAMVRETAGAHGCERDVSAQSLADYAERHAFYTGQYGVCAGPQALIDEYLRVAIDGASAPIRVEPDLASRLGDLDAAIDYGLHGQRVESAIRVLAGLQGLLLERLRAAFAAHAGRTHRTRLHEVLARPIDAERYPQLRTDHPLREHLELEVLVHRWFFERAGEALPQGNAPGAALLQLDAGAQAIARSEVAAFFARAFPDHASLPAPLRDELAAVTADVLALQRQCLRAVGREQSRLNERLRRAAPHRPLTSADLAVFTRPRSGPPLEETLADGLGLSITTDATSSALAFGDQRLSLTA